jgi:hypothetical protein
MLASTIGAFATLGDGKGKPRQKNLLTKPVIVVNPGTFSLKSNYDFRGNHIFNEEKSNYLLLNTTLTYQRGNTTYIVPLKKKLILDKIKFNPASTGNY